MKIKYFIQIRCSSLLINNKNPAFVMVKEKKIRTVSASFSVFLFSSQTDISHVHITIVLILISYILCCQLEPDPKIYRRHWKGDEGSIFYKRENSGNFH